MTPEHLDDFLKRCDDCEGVQREVLRSILSEAAETEIGRKLGFVHIPDAETYRQKVPVMHWHDIAPYAERLQRGESDLLFPGKPPTSSAPAAPPAASKSSPNRRGAKPSKPSPAGCASKRSPASPPR